MKNIQIDLLNREQDLIAQISRHSAAYYVRGQPEITDASFDALVKERDLYNTNYLELQKQNTILHEMLNDSVRLTDKMADGWCLVSPDDFEKLQQLSNQGESKCS